MKSYWIALLSLLLCLGVGCSDDELPETLASADVGAEGGDVQLKDGTRVEIPAGALPDRTRITVEKLDRRAVPPPTGGRNFKSDPYAFTPHGTAFGTPVRITLRSPDDGQDFQVVKLRNESDTNWQNVPGASRVRDEVSFDADGFSIYAVVEPSTLLDAGPAPDGGPTPDAGDLDGGGFDGGGFDGGGFDGGGFDGGGFDGGGPPLDAGGAPLDAGLP